MPKFDSDGVKIVYQAGNDFHLTAVPDRRYKEAVLDFLSERGGQAPTELRMQKE